MTELGTVILPIAGRSSRFPGTRPKWMLTSPEGPLMLEQALKPIPDWRHHRIVIGMLREHAYDLHGVEVVRRALGTKPEFVIFDDVTPGPAATVMGIIDRASVSGPIFIKDCDSWFDPQPDIFDNVVCMADLRHNLNLRNVASKSFVQINENLIVTGIYEKIVNSNYISVGGYGVRSAAKFKEAYNVLMRHHSQGEPFVSHVLLELIKEGEVFKGVPVSRYVDVGTIDSWMSYRSRLGAFFIDLDGVIFRNAGEFIPPLWSEEDIPLLDNVEVVRNLILNGAQINFVTARPEQYRIKTEKSLAALGLTYHSITFSVRHSRRTLVNDYASSNPYPSAVAVNLERNSLKLSDII